MTAFPLSVRTHAALNAATDPDWVPTLLGPDDDRRVAEAFVARVYREQFGAHLAEFMPWLLVFHDRQGQLRAAVGLRLAKGNPLFVEQYLDQPAEQAVAGALGRFHSELGNGATGSGLGLSIVRSVVARSGGTISLRDSELGGLGVTLGLRPSGSC